jgi:hypothetical protein
MKVTSFLPAIVGVQLGLAVTAVVAAPGDTLSRVGGAVTKVDGKTITVTDRRTQSDVTFAVTGSTKYTVSALGAVSDLKVGEKVMVMGQLNGNTVDARFIAVVPPGGMGGRMGGGRPGGQGGPGGFQPVQGTVATVTPSLTVTTDDKQTDTVNTTSDTRVMTSKAGSLSDITVGKFVSAQVDGSVNPPVAKQVQIRPAFGGGRGGFGGGRRGGGGGGQ